MSIRQLTELKRDYVPNSREFGRRAFARKFCCSISQIDYWLSSNEQLERRRKWRRLEKQIAALPVNLQKDPVDLPPFI